MVVRNMPDEEVDNHDEEEEAFYETVTTASLKDRHDCFRILGLTPGAGLDEIRSAYKRLARKWHPDKYDGHRDPCIVFQHVNEAYTALVKNHSSTDIQHADECKQSDLSRWLDEAWNWRSHRERKSWEKNGRTLVDRYYLYKGKWDEKELQCRTRGLFDLHGVELGELELTNSYLWWRFGSGIGGFEMDAVTGLVRIYACDDHRAENLASRLTLRFGEELVLAVEQSVAAEAWKARKADKAQIEESSRTSSTEDSPDTGGRSGSSRGSTCAGRSEGRNDEAGGQRMERGDEESFFSCTEDSDEAVREVAELERVFHGKKDTAPSLRKGPPRRTPPRRRQSSVDGGTCTPRTDARFERLSTCPDAPVSAPCKEEVTKVDEAGPSDTEGDERGDTFDIEVIGGKSDVAHAATYPRPDDLGQCSDPSSPTISSAEECCIDGYSSAGDIDANNKENVRVDEAYEAQYASVVDDDGGGEEDVGPVSDPKYIVRHEFIGQSGEEMSVVRGELLRVRRESPNGWALVRRYRDAIPHTWGWVPRGILDPLPAKGHR
ncbi:hypothetical protein FOZ63_031908 [Perkinsus olseni]|uniref:Uncharacterized protein n=1 Tax=Perkinsus olseni TaxID=32597 RepID=A0A7J6TK42_PEROL|nr:hypothetical protein FOZ63_031908 [Perkinsus olseni]